MFYPVVFDYLNFSIKMMMIIDLFSLLDAENYRNNLDHFILKSKHCKRCRQLTKNQGKHNYENCGSVASTFF